jgi:T5SS/PEP-CTERM-associated repeat protein
MAGFLVWIALGSRPSEAQYAANFQTNIISGVTNNWSGDYAVGNTNFADVLLVQNGGVLFNQNGYLGVATSGSNNTAVLNGSGSVWNNAYDLSIGVDSSGNRLIVTNGGEVFNDSFHLGAGSGSCCNTVLVSGSESALSCNSYLSIGAAGACNSMIIRDGGQVDTRLAGYVGDQPGSSNNSLVVAGIGAMWHSQYDLYIGASGCGNSLVISNYGEVFAMSSLVGGDTTSTNNRVLLTGPGSLWSSDDLIVGFRGAGEIAIISNGAQAFASWAVVGNGDYGDGVIEPNGSNCTVRVVDGGVWWTDSLFIGYHAPSNRLEIAGGSVYATALVVG